MAELVPARLRGPAETGADALILDSDGATLAVSLRRRGQEAPLGRIAMGEPVPTGLARLVPGRAPAQTLLRLPAAMLLEREVVLPIAAEREVVRVLAYEMDRFTPFAAEDVYWSHLPVRQDRAQARLWVRLSLVPKAGLAAVVAALRGAGRAPTALLVPAGDGAMRRIPLAAEDPAARRSARRATLTAASACAVLAVVAAGLPIFQQWRALAAIEARMERLGPAIAEAAALRRQIARGASSADTLAVEAARRGSALATLATLTDLLPDDTSLTALTLRQGQVTLTGQAANAAALIPRLSADAGLRDVAFLSPVTRAGSNRAELFSIQLELVP